MKLPKGIKFEDIRLSAEGVWYHDDVEITHKRTLDLLFKSIYQKKGKYYLSGEKFPVPIIVDDAAFFIRQLSRKNGKYYIKLSDGTNEELDITSLDVGDKNQLYCKIKDYSVKAIFERKVYYDLMKDLSEKQGYYGLLIDNIFYPVYSVALAKAQKELDKKAAKKPAKKKVAPKKPTKKKPVRKKPAKKKAVKKTVKKKLAKKKPAKKKPVKKKTVTKKTVKKKRKR